MPHFNLLKKKRTRDKEDGKDPSSPTVNDSHTSPVTPTATNTTTSSATDSAFSASDKLHITNEGNSMLQPSPSQYFPKDAPRNQLEQQVASAQNVVNPNPGHATGAIQPPSAQGSAPPEGQNQNAKPMSDGSWPVQRDTKATKGKYSLGDFDFRRTLGTGSFGRVHLVKSIHNQRFYAIKVLKKAQVVKMKQVEHTNDERKMLAKVKHPFLITLWGTFNDPKNLYMVMDFVEGGELFSLLRKSQVRRGLMQSLAESWLTIICRDSLTQSPNSTPPKLPLLLIICMRWKLSTAT